MVEVWSVEVKRLYKGDPKTSVFHVLNGSKWEAYLLVCSENRNRASNLKCKKKLSFNDEIVYKNIII
jgi:hypothetical protein